MQLASRTHEVDDIWAVQELYHGNGWTDGLPIVPPTAEAVQACLEWAMTPPDQLLGIEPVRGVPITAEKLAINAVMAGCLPMHLPVVLTAFTAMMQPEFLLHGATASTGGCAVLVVLNGPIRRELGASGTFNALANSDRATAVIGRALRLALINILEVRPGGIDR
ncbi:MAG: UGSC family (seleno)protein, partial [Acetobacteraceae bacterium]